MLREEIAKKHCTRPKEISENASEREAVLTAFFLAERPLAASSPGMPNISLRIKEDPGRKERFLLTPPILRPSRMASRGDMRLKRRAGPHAEKNAVTPVKKAAVPGTSR